MEKTEWMKQVVRAGRDFHVRQEDPLGNIESFFTSVVGSLCRLLLSAPHLSFPMAIVVGLFAGTLFLVILYWSSTSVLTTCFSKV